MPGNGYSIYIFDTLQGPFGGDFFAWYKRGLPSHPLWGRFSFDFEPFWAESEFL